MATVKLSLTRRHPCPLTTWSLSHSLSFGRIEGAKAVKSKGSGDSLMSMGKAGKMGKGGSMMSMGKASKGGSMMSMGKAGKGGSSKGE
jgi:hypothetical protein